MENYFHNCPAKMSDGRMFHDARTPTRRNESIKYSAQIQRDDEYRLMLQQKGLKMLSPIMTPNCGNNVCVHNQC